MAGAHPTAIVEPGAELAPGVTVGPYAVVRGCVRIGAGTRLGPHVVVGEPPQHRDDDGAAGRVAIGAGCELREFATVHRGTRAGGGLTHVGDGALVMVGAHVAHDAAVGAGATLANGVQLAGHVAVGAGAFLGGLAAVHQHARVGELAMVAAGSMVSQDVPPYCLAAGDRARLRGLNHVGLRRAGVPADARAALRHAYRTLFLAGLPLAEALARAEAELGEVPQVRALCAFARASRRGLCRPGGAAPGGSDAP